MYGLWLFELQMEVSIKISILPSSRYTVQPTLQPLPIRFIKLYLNIITVHPHQLPILIHQNNYSACVQEYT